MSSQVSSQAPLHTVSLASQVGGHIGVLTTEGGELLIKPALPRELEFYQKLQSDETFAALRPYVPYFIGTLKLEGEVDESNPQDEILALKPFSDKKDMFLGSHRFTSLD